jgi:hypothetical protein
LASQLAQENAALRAEVERLRARETELVAERNRLAFECGTRAAGAEQMAALARRLAEALVEIEENPHPECMCDERGRAALREAREAGVLDGAGPAGHVEE